MTKPAPNPIDIQDFQFRLQCRLKIFENTEITPFAKHCNAVAAASRFGLLFVSTNTSHFQVIQVKDVENCEYSRSDGPKTDYSKRVIRLEAPVKHLSVNCEHTILAVVLDRDSCCVAQFYDVKSFYQQSVRKIEEIRLSPTPGVDVVDIGWNPALGPIFTACKSDGTLTVCELKSPGVEINELPAQAGATCFCWSPKGKQIAVGSKDGKITQYKPDLKAVKAINAPQINNGACPLVALQWVSNYQFIGVFQTGNGQVSVIVVDAPKTGAVEFTNYEDICYSNGNARAVQFYTVLEHHWNILMVASSNSMEVGVMGLVNTSWIQWIMGDAYRAELPLSTNRQDTLPIGLALDTSSIQSVQFGDNNLPPAPMLFLLSHFGVLCCFKVVYSKAVGGVCSPPDPVTDLSGLGLFVAEHKVQQQVQQERQVHQQLQQQQQLKHVTFVETKPQSPKPENVSLTANQSPKPNLLPQQKIEIKPTKQEMVKNEEIKRTDEENEFLFAQLVRDECLFLDSQIKQIIKEGKSINIYLGTEEDKTNIVKITEALEIFLDLVVETCTTQNSEIHVLKQNVLQSWVWFEEAKSRYEQSQDGAIRILLKSQPLDSVSEKQLNDIRHSIYYLESQLAQANRALDEQWEMFQDYCKKTYRTQLPTMEAIFQAMVKQNAIMQKQSYILKDLSSKIRNRPHPALGAPLLLSLDNAADLEDELKRLRLSPDDIYQIQCEQIMNRQKKLTGRKTKQLGDFLRGRSYPVNSTVKPQMPATTPSKTGKELAILGAKMSPVSTEIIRKLNFNQVDPARNQQVKFVDNQPKTVGLVPTKNILPSSNSAFASTSFSLSTSTPINSSAKPPIFVPLTTVKQPSTATFVVSTTSSQPIISISSNAKNFSFSTDSTTTKNALNFGATTTNSAVLSLLGNKSVTISPVVPKTDSGTTKPFSFTALSKTQPSIAPVKNQPLMFTSTPFVSVGAKPTGTTASTAKIEPSFTKESPLVTVVPKTMTVITSVAGTTVSSTNKMFAPVKTTSTVDFSNVPTSEPLFVTAKSPTTSTTKGTAAGTITQTTSKSFFAINTTSNNVFGSVTNTTSTPPTSSQSTFGGTLQKSSSTSIFGGTSTAAPTSSSIFGNVATTNATSSSIFGTAAVTSTTPTKNIFGGVTTCSIFGANTSTPSVFSSPDSSTVVPASFSSVSSTTTTAASIFATSATSTVAPSVFGTATTSAAGVFSAPVVTPTAGIVFSSPTTSVIGTPVTASSIQSHFGSPTATPAPNAFGTPPTSAPGVFGTSPVKSVPSAFGTCPSDTLAASVFGSAATSTPAPSVFSTSAQSVFGTPPSATPASSVFASTPPTTPAPSVFGTATTSAAAPGMFGTQTAPAFGTVPSTTSPSIFSTPTSVPSAFGATSPASSVFGTPATSSSIFGSVTATSGSGQSVFGGSTTSGPSVFGNAGAAPMFGTTVTSQSVFGSPPSNMTTSSAGMFGSTPATTQGFGTFMQKNVFGSTPAATTASGFGTTATTQSSMFGNAQQSSVFGSPSTASSGFGQSQSVFGQSSPFNQQQQQQPAFGNSPSFGGSPAFGQTASIFANVPTTSASTGNIFGSTPTTSSSFGSTGSVFGAPVSAASVFGSPPASSSSFGSGFASPPTTNSFGFGGLNVGSTTTTTSGFGGGFGQQTPNPFAQKQMFGAPATSSAAFGQGTFGQSSGFGSTNTFGGSPSLFGQQQQSSTFGQNAFGSAFGSQQPSGPFSAGSTGVGQSGFGAAASPPTFQKPASGFGGAPVFGAPQPAFGGAPSFGGAPAFGGTAAFGSPSKVFGGGASTGFGPTGAQPQGSSFGNLANQNTVGFGSLAQQAANSQANAPFSGTSSFSSWR